MAIASPTHISRQSAKQINNKPDKQASPNMTNVPASMAFGVIQPCATARSGPNRSSRSAYNGLGDVCVLLFYGVIPVCFTYYIQTLSFSLLSFLLSVALGLLSVNILVVNNYRDYLQDKAARKRTTIVLFGRRFGRVFYILTTKKIGRAHV